MNDLIILV